MVEEVDHQAIPFFRFILPSLHLNLSTTSYTDSHLIVTDPADANSAAPASAASVLGLRSAEKVIDLIEVGFFFPRRASVEGK